MSVLRPPNYAIPDFPFPNRIPGRPFPPKGFELWPTVDRQDAKDLPQIPPIPPIVQAGDIITAVHENTVTTSLDYLWQDVEWLASQIAGGVVPTTRKIIAGAGMNGGGTLAADVTVNANVTSVFGRTGAVAAAPGDYTAAMVTNAVDKTQAYADPAWITSLAGSKVIPVAALQTPWLQDINAAGFELYNSGNVVIGAAVPVTIASPNSRTLSIQGPADGGFIEVSSGRADVNGSVLGTFGFSDKSNTANPLRAYIQGALSGTTANQRGCDLIFYTAPDSGTVGERMRIYQQGWIDSSNTLRCVGYAPPTSGVGLELYWDGTQGAAIAFDRSAVAWKQLQLSGSALLLNPNNGGNVGIGTTTPSARLHILAGANIDPSLTYGSAAAVVINQGSIDLAISTQLQAPYPVWLQARLFNNTGNPLVLNPLGGSVGIATQTPRGVFNVGNGQVAGNMWAYFDLNCGAVGPALAQTGVCSFAISCNISNGGGEVCFANASTLSGDLFRFYKANGMYEVLGITQSGWIRMNYLPSANPGAGTKMLWYDPADANRVKFAA